MKPFHILSAVEQLAEHLREEIISGALAGTLPGVHRLAKNLGVSPRSVLAAVDKLEHDGFLVNQGERRAHLIALPEGKPEKAKKRVRILCYDAQDMGLPHLIELMHQLREAGFAAEFSRKTLQGMGMDPEKVARHVAKTQADAWIVCAGSREVLEWFAGQKLPVIAMFGRYQGLPIAAAAPAKRPAMSAAVRRLVELGHRRIVMLVRAERRRPFPGLLEQTFLDELKAHGVPTGSYNLPDWQDNPAGFRTCLDSLFRTTPPTAMILGEPRLFAAARNHLAMRGLVVPKHVSLISTDPDPVYEWCDPAISHFRWDPAPVIKAIVKWAHDMARGKDERRQMHFDGEFVEGGTIGPVKPA